MDELSLTGMTLKEAREVLQQKGVTEYNIAITCPPRLKVVNAEDNFRVLMVYSKQSPITILVCKP